MRLLTNPGSNLSPEQIDRYRVTILPQRILVDGVAHDTRDGIPFVTVDSWVRSAERWPSTIGTTATETVAAFQALAKEGARHMLVVTTSKKVINSYESAVVARDTFLQSPQGHDAHIAIVDSGVTDVGANLVCALAGEAIAARLSWDEVVSVATAGAAGTRLVLSLVTLDNMVKGGRASFLRRFLADMLGVRPIVGFLPDGTMGSVGTYKKRGESIVAITDWLRGQVDPGRRVWVAAFHTGDDAQARVLVEALRKVYDVGHALVRPLASGVYLHAGPGAVGVAVCPVDRLGWKPPAIADARRPS